MRPGTTSRYSVYEDSGVAVDYQRGSYARTPIQTSQNGDTLRVEIGPVDGDFAGMPQSRGFELRLPADWPPSVVLVNSTAVPQSQHGQPGWRFEGNSLTTIVPVSSSPVSAKTVIEVRRLAGLTARRKELDGFAGTLAYLRGAFDAVRDTFPVSGIPPDPLIDAYQTGDRLSYHPERAEEEIGRFRIVVKQAAAAVLEFSHGFSQRDEKILASYKDSDIDIYKSLSALDEDRRNSLARALTLIQQAETFCWQAGTSARPKLKQLQEPQ
jgi:alpha-glucosidase